MRHKKKKWRKTSLKTTKLNYQTETQEEIMEIQSNEKKKDKMAVLTPYISIIILDVNN